MAHREQAQFVRFVKNRYPSFFEGSRVLEVGSLILNGTIRGEFTGGEFVGIDVGEGPGVDVVCRGEDFDDEGEFDVCASVECFEHNPEWIATFSNMHRLCRPGGLVFMTCATTGRKEHGTSTESPGCSPLTVMQGSDYYRNLTEADFRRAFRLGEMFSSYEFHSTDYLDTDFVRRIKPQSKDLYFLGIKHD